MDIDWRSSEIHILSNPRMPEGQREHVHEQLSQFFYLEGHVWIASSGSTAVSEDGIKWAALSKKAILASAKSVNAHLQSTSEDVWITALPDFHVGGLGIWARSFLSQASVIDYKAIYGEKWNAHIFREMVSASQATLSALVPAQVYDLVVYELRAPSSLRAVVVGGGKLPETLYRKALALGWNVLPSYGLTECASQVATADLNDQFPKLKVLSHVRIEIDSEGYICLKGESLLTGYALKRKDVLSFIDPKNEGWLKTEDKGTLLEGGSFLQVSGRESNFVKIGGESTDLSRLDSILEELRINTGITADIALFAAPDERLGQVIHLAVVDNSSIIQSMILGFNKQVLPFERIRAFHLVDEIPRTPLKKLRRESLLAKLF